MKTKKMAKALLSAALVIAMLFSMCIVGFVGVSAAGLDLNYEFAYNNAGYAEGRLSLSGESGTYILYWADETGALEGYTGIAQITVNSGKKYYSMPANTAIPAGATKVIAVESGKEATVENASAVFEIPESKQFKGGTKQYDFMALSDIHIDYNKWYQFSREHLANSLEVAAKRDVEFIATCGDNINGNDGIGYYDDEWKIYLQILAASNYNNPIYEANGNHESYFDDGKTSDPFDFGLNLFKVSTGLNATTGAVQAAPYFEKTINGDHHIFMAMELISKEQSPAASNTFTEAQINWLEGLLEKYEGDGHRIFIYEHSPFKGYGAGDDKHTPYYGASMIESYPQVKRLKDLLEANKDVITFSGHTHIDFKYGYNFDNENGKTAYTVHIPSNASTTHPNSSGGLDRPHDVNSSQGYLVDVYEKYVVLNGTDLAFNLICPSYTYLVDYTGEELDKNELEEIVYDTVDITVDVSNLTDAPESVVCIAVDENNPANNQSIPMTRNADGTYSAKVISEYSSVYFAINGASGVKTSAFPVANCRIILGYQTLNYTPANSVSFVRAHVWGDGGDGTSWPGTTMSKSGDSYTARIPASDYTGVVFNWGDGDSNKSADLLIADYITDRVDDVYIKLDSDETEPVTEVTEPDFTEPKPTETEATEATTTEVTEPAEVTTEATEATTEATEPTETTIVTEATEPTEITTSTPDETTVPTTATVPTTETTAPAVEYFYGDADLNEKINVKDATQVQKHTAKMLTLEGQALIQADVTGDSKVNIKDATAIQKYVAKLIDVFPVEEVTEAIVDVGANGTVMAEVKNVLSKEYQYASYDAYMALKKAYMNNVTDEKLNDAYTDYKTMKGKNPLANPGGTVTIGNINIGQTGTGSPTLPGPSYNGGGNSGGNDDNTGDDVTKDTIKVHFKPDSSWAGAHIYSFYGEVGGTPTGEPTGGYPGKAMTSEGAGWYVAEIPADVDYIKFTDGTGSDSVNNRTDNIPNSMLEDEVTFSITTKGAKYWSYNVGSAITPPDDDDNTGGDTGSYTVYAINSAKWDTMAAHAWNTGGSGTEWPGLPMTKTSQTVNGFDVYSITFDKEYGNIIFNNNDNGSKTVDLTFQTGQYFDVKGGMWYESLDEVPEVSAAATDRYLVGEFNDWNTTANEFMSEDGNVGYVKLELEANTTYEFKVIREGAWTSCKTSLSITDSTSGLVFSSSIQDNTTITTKSAGTYVFAFGISDSQLSVTYP